MQRPIGVILLAGAAFLGGLAQVYQMLVYLGILKFDFVGKSVTFQEAQWGPAFWSLIMALIWFWVGTGFWNLRAYALQFGIFISLFTLIWGFFALLFGNSVRGQHHPVAARRLHLPVPELPRCPEAVRGQRAVEAHARAA